MGTQKYEIILKLLWNKRALTFPLEFEVTLAARELNMNSAMWSQFWFFFFLIEQSGKVNKKGPLALDDFEWSVLKKETMALAQLRNRGY